MCSIQRIVWRKRFFLGFVQKEKMNVQRAMLKKKCHSFARWIVILWKWKSVQQWNYLCPVGPFLNCNNNNKKDNTRKSAITATATNIQYEKYWTDGKKKIRQTHARPARRQLHCERSYWPASIHRPLCILYCIVAIVGITKKKKRKKKKKKIVYINRRTARFKCPSIRRSG